MPIVTVAAIITIQQAGERKVLLTRRNIPPFKGQWCLPGGHIDRFETSEDAVVREVKEETGLDFVPQFFGHFDEIIQEMNIHAVVLVYAGTASGTLSAQLSEVADIGWFTLDAALVLPLAFHHNTILEAYVERTG